MARRPLRIEMLERLVKWSGSRKDFCRLTGVKNSNLSDYLSKKKEFKEKQLEPWTKKIFISPPAKIETLKRLIDWSGERKDFCRATGVKTSNLSDYLSRKKEFKEERLKHWADKIFTNSPIFCTLLECEKLHPMDNWDRKAGLDHPGIYALYDSGYRILYLGKAANLGREIKQTLRRQAKGIHKITVKGKVKFSGIVCYISAYTIDRGGKDFRHDVEALILKIVANSSLNENVGRFKRQI